MKIRSSDLTGCFVFSFQFDLPSFHLTVVLLWTLRIRKIMNVTSHLLYRPPRSKIYPSHSNDSTGLSNQSPGACRCWFTIKIMLYMPAVKHWLSQTHPLPPISSSSLHQKQDCQAEVRNFSLPISKKKEKDAWIRQKIPSILSQLASWIYLSRSFWIFQHHCLHPQAQMNTLVDVHLMNYWLH